MNISFSKAKTYRSTYKVKAIEVTQEMLEEDEDFTISAPQGELHGEPGDFIVQLPDGRIEVWEPTRFRKDFDVEQTKAPHRIEIARSADGEAHE
jgi:hypothetical protein